MPESSPPRTAVFPQGNLVSVVWRSVVILRDFKVLSTTLSTFEVLLLLLASVVEYEGSRTSTECMTNSRSVTEGCVGTVTNMGLYAKVFINNGTLPGFVCGTSHFFHSAGNFWLIIVFFECAVHIY